MAGRASCMWCKVGEPGWPRPWLGENGFSSHGASKVNMRAKSSGLCTSVFAALPHYVRGVKAEVFLPLAWSS